MERGKTDILETVSVLEHGGQVTLGGAMTWVLGVRLTWREYQGKVGDGKGQIEQVEFSVWSMWCLVTGLVMTAIRNIIDRVKSLQVRVYCDEYLGP